MGKAVPKPVTAETIRFRYDSMRRARIAAGLPIEGGLQVPVEDTEVPSQVDIASTESVASSLR